MPSYPRIAQLEQENAALQSEIASLRQRESVLQQSERRFRYTFEQAAVGMALRDLSGQWLQINQYFCDMLGYTEAELKRLTWIDITYPDDIADTIDVIPRLIRGELPSYHAEKRYIRKDGSLLWATLTIFAVHDALGQPVCFTSIVQDISSRKKAELMARSQQRALQNTFAVLATKPELDKFLGQVLATIVEQLQASVVDVWLHNSEKTATKHYLTHWNTQLAPSSAETLAPDPILLSTFHQGAAFDVLYYQGQPFLYSDLPSHPDFKTIFQPCASTHKNVQTLLLVPLIFGDEFLGVFSISHMQSHPYPPEILNLVTALAQQVVLAIQLTRLADEAQQVALMEEHNRIAREIHDTLAQTFNGISLQLSNAQYYADQDSEIAWDIVEQVKTLARSGLVAARRSVWSLHPDADEYRNLAESLQKSLALLTRHTELKADLKIIGTSCAVPPDIGMNLLRIGQEATTNTLRHAQAKILQVELAFTTDAIELRIVDDGRGFHLPNARNLGGFGLMGMQQRCDRLGGQLTLRSQPGEGTCILVQIPLPTQ